MKKSREERVIIGCGLDGDGHTRITTGDNFILQGGTKETHERMQEITVKINEKLCRKHKSIDEVSSREVVEIIKEAME